MPNLRISDLPELTTGVTGNSEYVISQDGVTYKIKDNVLNPFKKVYGMYSQTSDSVIVSGTTTETTIIGSGIGVLTVPENGFTVGDSFSAKLSGTISSQNNDTIRIRVKSGSVVFLDSNLQTTTSLTNELWELFIDFTIRGIGGSGVASINSSGAFHTTKKNSSSVEGFSFRTLNNTTFDTTVINTLDITVQWGSTNVNNKIDSDFFVLNKIF
jgi:hypothetical protein